MESRDGSRILFLLLFCVECRKRPDPTNPKIAWSSQVLSSPLSVKKCQLWHLILSKKFSCFFFVSF